MEDKWLALLNGRKSVEGWRWRERVEERGGEGGGGRGNHIRGLVAVINGG